MNEDRIITDMVGNTYEIKKIEPKKKKRKKTIGWVNVYSDSDVVLIKHATKKSAQKAISETRTYIATIKIRIDRDKLTEVDK